MFDDEYDRRRLALLKNIKRLSGKDESKRFPRLETRTMDDDYTDACWNQLEVMERQLKTLSDQYYAR